MNLQLLCDQALALHRAGRHAEALALFDRMLAENPDFFPAFNLRGNLLSEMGRPVEALGSYERAVAIRPDFAEAHYNRGNMLQHLRRFGEALESYDRAIAIRPDFAEAWNNRGNAMRALNRMDEALASYDRVLALHPGIAEVWDNRGSILRALRRFGEALESYERAIAIKPDYAQAWNNRGTVLWEMKNPGAALESYDRAVTIRPGYAEAWNNRGSLLRQTRRFAEALASYERALAIAPDYVEALSNREIVLRDLNRFDEALASYDRAVAIKPDHADALYNRSVLEWAELGRYEPALRDLEHTLAADPDYVYARGELLHLRMLGGDWRDYDRERAAIDDGVRAGKRIADPFIYQAVSQSPADLLACAAIHAAHRYPAAPVLRTAPYRGHPKIRIGYVSGEFREQATAYLMAGLYEHHDKARFEIVAFDNGWSDEGPMRKRMEAAFDKFIAIANLSDEAAAGRVRDQEIDILVNLNGYFGKHRMGVFARRPAPVQVNYLGFPGTLGADYIDYIVADRFVIPEGEEQFYTEKVVRLPDTYQANDSRRAIAEVVPTRAACGLPENAFVFCNFNNSYKFTPETFAQWMRILGQVPGSVLWLLESTPVFPENLRHAAQAQGVAGERLVFAPTLPVKNHLARLRLADLFLNSLPYNAHTTASDALWAGVPLLTCRGHAFPGRVAASLLHAVGLPELVTDNMGAYEVLALKLARDPASLRAIRDKLEKTRLTTPLFDTDRFRRHIEAAYTRMWEISQRGEGAMSFQVEQPLV